MATMHCESENNENSETFWSRENEALSSGSEERFICSEYIEFPLQNFTLLYLIEGGRE